MGRTKHDDSISTGPQSGSARSRSIVFTAVFYFIAVMLMLGACWLFIKNIDQLFPEEGPVRTEAMNAWGDETRKAEFAGGFWKLPSFWRSVNITFVSSTVTMLIAAAIGIPASYALSRYRIPGRALIDVLFSSIIVLPASSVGLCLVVMFQYGPLHDILSEWGIHVPLSVPGIVVVQLVLSLAMGMSAWRAAFDGVNPRFEHVARSLGASPWYSFRTVTLPSARSVIFAGLILAWTRAAAEFGGVLTFCSTFEHMSPEHFSPILRALQLHQADPLAVSMWSQIEYGNVELGFALGFVLVMISALSVYVLHRIGGKGYIW